MSVEGVDALILIIVDQPSRNHDLVNHSICIISRVYSWRVILLSYLLASNITICKSIINLCRYRRVNALIIIIIIKLLQRL